MTLVILSKGVCSFGKSFWCDYVNGCNCYVLISVDFVDGYSFLNVLNGMNFCMYI